MTSESIKKANNRYKKNHTKLLVVRFYMNSEKDRDLLSFAKSQENTASYIKGLIEADMRKEE